MEKIRKTREGNQFRVGLILLLVVLINLPASGQNERKKLPQVKTKVVLFDGSSTDAWRDTKSEKFPEEGWITKDGILTVLAKTDQQEGGHDIISKEQFSNFELELEVRLSEGANSGVKYMVVNTYPGNENQFLGLEYQLIDNAKHPDALLGRNGNRKMAALYDLLPAPDDITIHPVGEWNKVKIVVNKNRVEHWLNDKKVVFFYRDSDCYKELVRMSKYSKLKDFGGQKQGHILLQGHGNEVSFRNIRITTW